MFGSLEKDERVRGGRGREVSEMITHSSDLDILKIK
jgi:hypothetical protein